MTVLSPTARCGAEGGAGTEGSEQLGKLFTAMNTAGSGELSLAVGFQRYKSAAGTTYIHR